MGDEQAFGDPWVSDAERAAAGRQTVAGRQRELDVDNRRRAAERYAAGSLPEGEQALRVWARRDPAALSARLGDDALAVWAEGDVLNVLWRGSADAVALAGGVQCLLWPVEGVPDLWEASLRIRDLDRAVIWVGVDPRSGDDPPLVARAVEAQADFRGRLAPPALPDTLPAGTMSGTLQDHRIDSAVLRRPRGVTVYRPPTGSGPLPACVMADGESLSMFAGVYEPLLLAGSVPPVLLVGVHNGHRSEGDRFDRRAHEYVPGADRGRFAAHLAFVIDEVIPWAQDLVEVAPGPWLAMDFSNGAAWAIGAGQRRPDVFDGVAAFSAGVVPGRIRSAARARGVRHYLAAGTLEGGFRRETSAWAERLRRAGQPVTYHEWVGGHDFVWWQQQCAPALAWLLDPRHGRVPPG